MIVKYSFAPLEGVTDCVYRRLHHRYFGGVDRYFMPFFSPTIHRTLTPREERELPLAEREPFSAVPQVLTKNAQDFLWAAQVCHDRGYGQIDLNLGCPSGTVVAKGKGAGMLADPDALDCFFDTVFRSSPIPISVKTRLGLTEPEEFEHLMQVFNRYPICELTVHPRVRKDFYAVPVCGEWFAYAVEMSRNPVCYNGNLTSKDDITAFCAQYPCVQSLMLGRGLIGDPGMLTPEGTSAEKLEAFLDELFASYIESFGSVRNAMFRMKENWRYLLCHFDGSEKLAKRLRKTTDASEYRQIVAQILHTLPMTKKLDADW